MATKLDLEKRQYELENRLLELKIATEERLADRVSADAKHNGEFLLVGTIHELSVHRLMEDVKEYVRTRPGAPVNIMLNSGGGSVTDGLALVDYIKKLSRDGHLVTVTGYGMVASMAGAVLMAADIRVLTPRTYLGMHEVSSVVAGSVSSQEDGVKFAKRLQDEIVSLICERSTLTPRKLKAMWERRDVYVNAQEALKLGLIDRIEEL